MTRTRPWYACVLISLALLAAAWALALPVASHLIGESVTPRTLAVGEMIRHPAFGTFAGLSVAVFGTAVAYFRHQR